MNRSLASAARQVRAELSFIARTKKLAQASPDSHAWPRELLAMAWYRWLVLPARAVYSYARYRLAQGRAAPESRWWCPRIGDPVSDCFGRYGTVARVDIFSGMASVLYRDPSRFEEISWMNCLSPDLR